MLWSFCHKPQVGQIDVDFKIAISRHPQHSQLNIQELDFTAALYSQKQGHLFLRHTHTYLQAFVFTHHHREACQTELSKSGRIREALRPSGCGFTQ